VVLSVVNEGHEEDESFPAVPAFPACAESPIIEQVHWNKRVDGAVFSVIDTASTSGSNDMEASIVSAVPAFTWRAFPPAMTAWTFAVFSTVSVRVVDEFLTDEEGEDEDEEDAAVSLTETSSSYVPGINVNAGIIRIRPFSDVGVYLGSMPHSVPPPPPLANMLPHLDASLGNLAFHSSTTKDPLAAGAVWLHIRTRLAATAILDAVDLFVVRACPPTMRSNGTGEGLILHILVAVTRSPSELVTFTVTEKARAAGSPELRGASRRIDGSTSRLPPLLPASLVYCIKLSAM
jgi:hypothetical protein